MTDEKLMSLIKSTSKFADFEFDQELSTYFDQNYNADPIYQRRWLKMLSYIQIEKMAAKYDYHFSDLERDFLAEYCLDFYLNDNTYYLDLRPISMDIAEGIITGDMTYEDLLTKKYWDLFLELVDCNHKQ